MFERMKSVGQRLLRAAVFLCGGLFLTEGTAYFFSRSGKGVDFQFAGFLQGIFMAAYVISCLMTVFCAARLWGAAKGYCLKRGALFLWFYAGFAGLFYLVLFLAV